MTFQEFLEGIANAIRSKTGNTDPIKPINFASEIANIQAGGNGGSSQSGVYLELLSRLPINRTYSRFFKFKGNLYLWANNESKDVSQIYKYENNEFTLVCDVPLYASFAIAGYYASYNFIEYKDKLYVSIQKDVISWDGETTFEKVTTLNYLGSFPTMAVYNNQLYDFQSNYNGMKIYKFDDVNKTFTLIKTDTKVKDSFGTINYCGNNVYFYSSNKNLYKFNGETFDLVTTTPDSCEYTKLMVTNDCIYFKLVKSGTRYICEYDINTKEYKILNSLLIDDWLGNLIEHNDKCYLISNHSSAYNLCFQLHGLKL